MLLGVVALHVKQSIDGELQKEAVNEAVNRAVRTREEFNLLNRRLLFIFPGATRPIVVDDYDRRLVAFLTLFSFGCGTGPQVEEVVAGRRHEENGSIEQANRHESDTEILAEG